MKNKPVVPVQRKITIEINLPVTEYRGARNTDEGAIALAISIMRNYTDWPDRPVKVTCGNVSRVVNNVAYSPDRKAQVGYELKGYFSK